MARAKLTQPGRKNMYLHSQADCWGNDTGWIKKRRKKKNSFSYANSMQDDIFLPHRTVGLFIYLFFSRIPVSRKVFSKHSKSSLSPTRYLFYVNWFIFLLSHARTIAIGSHSLPVAHVDKIAYGCTVCAYVRMTREKERYQTSHTI